MKTLILAVFVTLGFSVGAANAAHPTGYHPPAQNFYQNNWMAGD